MFANRITESEIENFTLDELEKLKYTIINGIDIAPDSENEIVSGVSRRKSYSDVLLENILIKAIDKLNHTLPQTAKDQALKSVLSVYSPQLIDANEAFHKMLTEGVPVTVQKYGQERGERVWLVDFQNPATNSCLAINQQKVRERN